MEEKTYYSVANLKENGLENKDITYIPLEKIVLDPGMEFAGRQFCHEILKTKKVKTLRDGLETNLYKWDKVSKDFIGAKFTTDFRNHQFFAGMSVHPNFLVFSF